MRKEAGGRLVMLLANPALGLRSMRWRQTLRLNFDNRFRDEPPLIETPLAAEVNLIRGMHSHRTGDARTLNGTGLGG